jgi:hypothetical protein
MNRRTDWILAAVVWVLVQALATIAMYAWLSQAVDAP